MQTQGTTNIDRIQSATIDWLRFPMIICVAFIHNWGYGGRVTSSNINWATPSSTDFYHLIRIVFTDVIPHIAVPFFFLVSGYYFFYYTEKWDYNTYKKKIKKRVKTILIPYLLWNLLVLFYDYGYHLWLTIFRSIPFESINFFRAFWNINVTPEKLNLIGLPYHSTFPINGPLWFLRDLILLIFLTPIIHKCITKGKWLFILLLLILFVFNILPYTSENRIRAVFFFSSGAYLGVNKKNLILLFQKYKLVTYILCLIFLLLSIYYNGHPFGTITISLYIIFGIISVFNIASKLLQDGIVKVHPWLVGSVFFVYAFHHDMFFLLYDIALLPKIHSSHTLLFATITYFTIPFLKIGICLLVFKFMQKYMPNFLGVLTGNRS